MDSRPCNCPRGPRSWRADRPPASAASAPGRHSAWAPERAAPAGSPAETARAQKAPRLPPPDPARSAAHTRAAASAWRRTSACPAPFSACPGCAPRDRTATASPGSRPCAAPPTRRCAPARPGGRPDRSPAAQRTGRSPRFPGRAALPAAPPRPAPRPRAARRPRLRRKTAPAGAFLPTALPRPVHRPASALLPSLPQPLIDPPRHMQPTPPAASGPPRRFPGPPRHLAGFPPRGAFLPVGPGHRPLLPARQPPPVHPPPRCARTIHPWTRRLRPPLPARASAPSAPGTRPTCAPDACRKVAAPCEPETCPA